MTAVIARLIGAIGLLATLAVGAMLLVAPDLPGIRTLAATGALGLAGWLYLDWPAVSEWLVSRGGIEAARAGALVLTLCAAAGVSVVIAERYGVRWDLSPDGAHSVQARTLEILGELDLEVAITAYFVADGDPIERAARARWDAMASAFDAASPRLRVQTLDPDVSRRAADRDDVRSNGVVIVRVDERFERLFAPDEESLLNTILRVAAARERAVYFTSGSGERRVTEGGRVGLGLLAARLRALGLRVEARDVLRSPAIPDDAAVVLVIDPETPIADEAARRLAAYVDGGGALLVAGERGRATGLEAPLARWGLALGEGLIVDPLVRAVVGDATAPLVAEYGIHAAVRGLRSPALFPGAAAVLEAEHDPTALTLYPLALTSELAWAELTPDVDPMNEDPDDLPGPLPLLQLSELHPGGTATGMVVLAGDADWLSDPAMEQLGNGDLAIRVLGFLGKQADLVRLPPREVARGALEMDWMARVVVGILAVIVVPGLCFGAAAGLWMVRRRA